MISKNLNLKSIVLMAFLSLTSALISQTHFKGPDSNNLYFSQSNKQLQSTMSYLNPPNDLKDVSLRDLDLSQKDKQSQSTISYLNPHNNLKDVSLRDLDLSQKDKQWHLGVAYLGETIGYVILENYTDLPSGVNNLISGGLVILGSCAWEYRSYCTGEGCCNVLDACFGAIGACSAMIVNELIHTYVFDFDDYKNKKQTLIKTHRMPKYYGPFEDLEIASNNP